MSFFSRTFLLAIVFWVSSGWSYNHPEIKWMSVETDHFIFHYYNNTEPLLAPAMAVAEEVYPHLVNLYGSIGIARINIVLGDYDDLSNGFADWLGGGVEIWTPDLLFPFRGSPTWLRNVMTHELSHIFSLRKAQGLQMIVTGVSAGLHLPGVDANVGKFLPMMKLFPMWFAEGLAQTGSTRCGNDCWDNRRDMVLRCAVLDHALLTPDQMGVFASDQTGNEMVYNQGFSLTMHIEQMVGAEEIRRLIGRSNRPLEITAAVQPAPGEFIGGRDLDYYYRQWRDSLLYAARKAIPLQPTGTGTVWQKGRINNQPRTASGSGLQGWLTGNNDDSYRTDLNIMRKGARGDPLLVLKHAETSWDFSPRGDCVYFIKSYNPGKNGSYLKELFRCTIGTGKVEQLTRGGRIYACAASPNNREVAVVRFNSGRFSLELLEVNSGAFRIVDAGVPGNTFAAIDYDPGDSSKLIGERIVDGRSALYSYNLAGGAPVRISSGRALEESPCWAQNGRIYFSADYDGIFNIYSVRADGSDLQRHTSVVGGAFEPAPDVDGTTLLFSEYTSSGFRIVQTGLTGEAYTVPSRSQCYFKPLTGGAVLASMAMPYRLRMLRAGWESSVGLDVYNDDNATGVVAGIGFIRAQSDALNRLNYFLGASIGGVGGVSTGIHSAPAATTYGFLHETPERFDRFQTVVDSAAGIGPGYRSLFQRPRPVNLTEGYYTEGPGRNAAQAGNAPVVLITPQCGVVLKNFEPTISSTAAINFLYVLPYMLNSQSDIAWQAGRGAAFGATILGNVVLAKLLTSYLGESDTTWRKVDDSLKIPKAGGAIPLWFNWQSTGYYNQDIQHNYNDVWEAGLTVTPSKTIGMKDGISDSMFSVQGISGTIDVSHGFPLTKYSGIPVEIGMGFSRFDIPVNGTILDSFSLAGNSDLFVRSQSTVSFAFPIHRTIKSGRRLFYDALYGKIGYYFSATANRSFLVRLQNSGSRWGEILADNAGSRDPDPGFEASHLLFLSVEVNSISDFLISSGTSCTGVIDVVKGGAGVYFSAQF